MILPFFGFSGHQLILHLHLIKSGHILQVKLIKLSFYLALYQNMSVLNINEIEGVSCWATCLA